MFNKKSGARAQTVEISHGTVKAPKGNSKIPSYFICPITLELMEDPTITQCGHMFDRESIKKWISEDRDGKKGCPLCHNKISDSALAPCFPLKAAIQEFKAKKCSGEGINVLQSINRKMANLNIFGSGGKNEKEPEPSSPPASQERKRAPHGESRSPPARRADTEASSSSRSKNSKKTWCKLKPILNTYEILEINREEFTLGRNSNCDHIYTASEISSVHCTIYRVPRDSKSNEYDYFIEDKSTNGSYVNGNRVGKGLIASIVDGDELSLGERFSSKVVPKVAAFVDWVFLGVDLTPERKADMMKAKEIESFYELVEMDDAEMRNLNIRSGLVRSKILEATKNWLDKYRFPAYRIEIGGSAPVAGPPSTIKKKHKSGTSAKDSSDALGDSHASLGSGGNFSSKDKDASEISFEPCEYSERASSGVVCMYLKRSKLTSGPIQVVVRTTDKGTVKPGSLYQAYEKKFGFADGVADLTVEFFWRTDQVTTPNTVICFEVKVVSGKGYIGKAGEAKLDIEMSTTKQKKRHTEPPVAQSVPILKKGPREAAPSVREYPKSLDRAQSPSGGSDTDEAADEPSEEDKQRIQALDDEILALMMESFPSIEPHLIAKIVKQEREMMAPLEDRYLLQDMVTIKLSNMTKGTPDEWSHTNIKMMKVSQSEAPEEEEQEEISTPAAQMPVPKPIPSPAAANVNPMAAAKLRQTVLRSELESFLFMASISLIRKFFTIQGIDCNYCHFASPVVSISMNLTHTFMKTLDSVKPVEVNQQDRSKDLLEFDEIVELFKKYIFQNGSELRSKAVQLDPKGLASGYKYDVAFQKSSHHFKMENNHAVIEDLNRFAGIPMDQPMNSFFGVFDGHGGYLISEYLSLHLAANIAKQPCFTKNIMEAIRLGYQKTDELVMMKNARDKIRGGSTSVTAIIRENNIYVAWAGDSRCIVFRRMGANLVAFPIITPHNPQGSEKQRVVKAGGFVEFIAGKWRVNGRLAVTRSFGDDNLKPIVTAEPEITKFPIMGDEEFLMLSCDGLYDVMDYSDVAEYFDQCLKKGMKLGQLAAAMVQEGVKRKSTDDITVMLINLSRNPDL